jgi:NAD(P)-dependent dehydrogenase (short-subunit alcohol dehydrogenase family)
MYSEKLPPPVALVTGAGSGVGRAVVLKLAAEGWQVALTGRRAEPLHETVSLARRADSCAVFPCDLGDPDAVARLAGDVLARFGQVDAAICSAGTNTPKRSWSELSLEGYHELLTGNLHAAYHCTRAFLPGMRERRSGTFVYINSEAGLKASAKSGVGYVAAKFGLTGLAQSLNAEERANGIRACSIFPGDIDTALLEQRPQPPTAEARARMMQPEDVAACVWLALSLPARAVVEELVIRPA